jgi:predicted helicase
MKAKIHDVLKSGPYSNWDELHEQISQIDESTTAKGDAFEQFSYFYLLYHKAIFQIEEVWCDKVPKRAIPYDFKNPEGRYRIRDHDEGTDLVAQLKGFEEPHEAYQAKFRSDSDTHPSSDELRTFWSDSQRFEQRRIITSSTTISKKDQDSNYYENSQPAILRGNFLNILDSKDFFEQLHRWANDLEKVPKRVLHEPRSHQQEMIDDVVNKFDKLKKKEDQRGKLIAACGTGKTLAALWITEHPDLEISNLLFLAPTIELTAQTFREWAMQHRESFDFLIVCSDSDAGTIEEDHSDISVSDVGIRVTTDAKEILNFLEKESDKRKYVFSTYQSSDRIKEAIEIAVKFESFDLIIFDEAHRTASKTLDPKGSMQVAIDNGKIKSKRRLFMTATERVQTPRVKKYLESEGKDYFSMDDEDKYGATFHTLTFGRAIEIKIIADYRIILAACDYQDIGEEELLDSIAEVNGISRPLTSLEVYQALFVSKLFDKNQISKTLTFQNTVARAQAFSYLLKQINGASNINIDAIWGEEGIASRREKKSRFGLAEKAVLSNVRCLSEGVDLPMIDSVVFCDDRSSPIDLIQAIGRALRIEDDEEKVASILIPIPIPLDTKTLDDIDWDNVPGMTTFHEILQAMRDQDSMLNEEIDDIHIQTTKRSLGKSRTRSKPKKLNKILVIPPAALKINLHDMWDKIGIRISDANFRKSGESSVFGVLGKEKGDRKSTALKLPIFGDYSVAGAMKKECLVVLEELSEERVPIAKSIVKEYAVDSSELDTKGHNTVSMLAAIGAVKNIDSKNCMITSLGLRLKENPDQWDKAVINQALIYSENGIHPYRLVLQALLNNKGTLNYHEFLLGISQIETIGVLPNLDKMDQTIKYLRTEYPNGLNKVPDGKHDEVITGLESDGIEVNLAPKDIWSTKTTQWNKWIYMKSVMAILPFVEIEQHKIFIPNKESVKDLKIALLDSERVLGKEYGSDASWWHKELEEDDFSFG